MLPTRDCRNEKWGHTKTETEGIKKVITCDWEWKECWVAVLIPNKRNLKRKSVIKNKGRHWMGIKESIQQKDTAFISTYASSIVLPKYIKQI